MEYDFNPYDEMPTPWEESQEEQQQAMQPLLGDWYCEAGGKPLSGASVPQRAERSGEAALSGNTGIQTSNTLPWQVSGGVDYLEVTCWGHYESVYGEFDRLLDEAWQNAASGKGKRSVPVLGATLVVREKGFRWGRTFFHYVCEYDGITYALRRASSGGEYVAKVQISSLKLMRDGHWAAWNQAVATLKALGVVVGRTHVTRIDLCLDLPGIDVTPFVEAIMGGCYVGRATATQFWKKADGQWNGVGVGSRKNDSVYFRVYDKIDELKNNAKDAELKRYVLIERRWGVEPEKAARAEFQVGGGWLKKKWSECSTVEEVFGKLGAIMEYLTTTFFRITETEVDRENNNQSKAATSSLWSETVVNGFKSWIDQEAVELIRAEKKPVDRSKAGKRLVSAALSVAALTPGAVRNTQSLMQHTVNALARWLPENESEWLDKLQRKIDDYEASGATNVFSFDETDDAEFGSYRVMVEDVPSYHIGVRRAFVSSPTLEVEQVPF